MQHLLPEQMETIHIDDVLVINEKQRESNNVTEDDKFYFVQLNTGRYTFCGLVFQLLM